MYYESGDRGLETYPRVIIESEPENNMVTYFKCDIQNYIMIKTIAGQK